MFNKPWYCPYYLCNFHCDLVLNYRVKDGMCLEVWQDLTSNQSQ